MKLLLFVSALVVLGMTLPADACRRRRRNPATPSTGRVTCSYGSCQCSCTAGRMIQASTPPTNQCGAAWMPSSLRGNPYNFGQCCDSHDRCYGTCGRAKRVCDSEFNGCMATVCSRMSSFKRAGCLATRAAFYRAVRVGGCFSYTSAHKARCRCA